MIVSVLDALNNGNYKSEADLLEKILNHLYRLTNAVHVFVLLILSDNSN